MSEISFEDLTAGLRGWTRSRTAHEQAAVELLIWHETWLRRPDFKSACIRRYGGVPCVRWHEARQFAEDAPRRASSSQLAVLRLAVALALDDFGLGGLGISHKRAVAEAFAAACGLRLEPAVPEAGHSHPGFIPGDPATCHRCALEAGDESRPLPGGPS